jgi:hypothetical protein
VTDARWLPVLMMGSCLVSACDPYAAWPDPTEVFPWGVPPEEDLPPYALVRVETETWTPLVDLQETALYIQKAFEHKPSAHRDVILHFGEMRSQLPALVPGDARLSLVGDVMRFGGNWSTFADGVADRLDGDIRVGNLETPVSDLHPVDAGELARDYGLYAFNSPPELLDGLPLDLLQLNNNHSLDLGDEGLERTIEAVAASGRAGIGVDGNVAVAEVRGVRVGFVSFTWGMNVQDPSAHDLHMVPFGHLDEPVDLQPVRASVAVAREAGADFVVVLVHWGFEYEYYPDPHFLRLGRRLVEVGADLVVGSGPHAVEPAEICEVNRPLAPPGLGRCSVRDPESAPRTAAILYSLGDFGTDLATLPLQVGLVASVSFDGVRGVTGLGWEGVASVSEGGGQRMVPLEDLLEDEAYAAEAARLDQLLGVRWRR